MDVQEGGEGEGEGREGSRGELCRGGQGVRSCFISLFPSPTPTHSLQNPQNKTSPFSVSPTGPSTKVSTCQGSQGRGRGVLQWARFGIWERVPDACRGPRAWYLGDGTPPAAPSHSRAPALGL